MKADRRISLKDYRRGKTLRVTRAQVPFGPRQFFVREHAHPHLTPALSPPSEGAEREKKPWPASGQPVSLSRVFAALRKAVVRAQEG